MRLHTCLSESTHVIMPHCWKSHVATHLGSLKYFVFVFSAAPFSVGETLHVGYKKYEIKRKFTFLVNTKNISSHELKTLGFSLGKFPVMCPPSTHNNIL